MTRPSGRTVAGATGSTTSAAPGSGATGPEPALGTALDDRYRLLRRLPGNAPRWAAVDELLDRPVEIRLTAPASPLPTSTDPRWLRVLDAGELPGAGWLAVEDPCRPTLAERVASTPYDAAATVGLVRELTAAMASGGAPATALHPDRVYCDADGVRLDTLPRPGEPAVEATEAEAVRAIGRLGFCALTGRWPGAATGGVPGTDEGGATSARRLRGGIPRQLDAVVSDAMAGRIGTLEQFTARLDRLPRAREKRAGPSAGVLRARRVLTLLAPPALIALLGLGAWFVGSDLGAVPGADVVPAATPRPTAAHRAPHLVWTHPPAVTSFDPGGDGSEDASAAAAAVDGRPRSSWRTDLYQTSTFGGLKAGVGLLIDLGHPKTVDGAEFALSPSGARVQLRAGDHRPSSARQLPLVAQVHGDSARPSLQLRRPVTARYWLVWFTRLPAVPGGYREGVREIRLSAGGSGSREQR